MYMIEVSLIRLQIYSPFLDLKMRDHDIKARLLNPEAFLRTIVEL